jgi:hypothetical protein
MNSTVQVRTRTCNCVEVGIAEDGVIIQLLRARFRNPYLVEECTHWEYGEIEV